MPRPRSRIMIFYIHKSLIEYRLGEVESFIHHSRRGMKAMMDEFSARFDRATAGWPQDRIESRCSATSRHSSYVTLSA